MKRLLLFAAVSAFAASCASSVDDNPETDDPIDECVFCETRADAHGISRESYLAYGILNVANSATFNELDVTVGLDARAAQGIVAGRPFQFIEQIDTVPYIGSSAFAALADYAESIGLPACGDGTLQPLVESCDDGNLVDGDGCSAQCTNAGPAIPALSEMPELIRGDEIGVPQVGPRTYYLRERVVDADRGYPQGVLDVMRRGDGIKANEHADGRLGYDELAILSTTPFYDSLLAHEKAALDETWELFRVNSAGIGVIDLSNVFQAVGEPYTLDVSLPGDVVVRPRPISDFDASIATALLRLQQMPGTNLDNDSSTVEVHDIDKALADYEQVFTAAEFALFPSVAERIISESDELSSPGGAEVTWNLPFDEETSGTVAGFDGYEVAWTRTQKVTYTSSYNMMGWVSFLDFAQRTLHHNGQPVCTANCGSAPRHLFATLDDHATPSFDGSVRLWERWENGRRVYNRLVYVTALPRTHRTVTPHHLFGAHIKDPSGQRYRLEPGTAVGNDIDLELVPTSRRSDNVALTLPEQLPAIQAYLPGNYGTFQGVRFSVTADRRVIAQNANCTTPLGYQSPGELIVEDDRSTCMRGMVAVLGSDRNTLRVRVGNNFGAVERDLTNFVERR